jgi:hypothetical protein
MPPGTNQGRATDDAAYLGARRGDFWWPRGILVWGPGPGKARIVKGGHRVTVS